MKTRAELRIDGDVARVTLVPEPETKPPVLDWDLFGALMEITGRIRDQHDRVRAVILSSASARHFMVGANIQVLAGLTEQTIGDWVRTGHEAFNAIESLPMPVVARVEGNAMGGGLELALACDLIVAGPHARFAQPEVGIGVITGHGGAWRLLRRVGPGSARRLLFSGQRIDADEALRIGLCDMLGTPDEIDRWIATFLDGVRPASPSAIAETKALLQALDATARRQACDLEVSASTRLFGSADTADRIQAFLTPTPKNPLAPRSPA